jgi:hypothetical protein
MSATPHVARRTIRRQQLREIVPLADSTIYDMEQRGEFSASISPRAASSGTWQRWKPGSMLGVMPLVQMPSNVLQALT